MIRRDFLRRAGTAVAALFSYKIVQAAKIKPHDAVLDEAITADLHNRMFRDRDFRFKPGTLQLIPIDKIVIDKECSTRLRPHSPEFIKHLQDDIMLEGLLTPLTITADGALVCGFARYEAIKDTQMKEVLCYVLPLDRSEAIVHAYNSNAMRFNPILSRSMNR